MFILLVNLVISLSKQGWINVVLFYRNLLLCCAVMSATLTHAEATWQAVSAQGSPTARHEAALVAFEGELYLLGGRGLNPVDVYSPVTGKWRSQSKPPIEIHHFQAVVVNDAIYMVGAMTGRWPYEKPLDRVLVYYPKTDTFEYTHTIPIERRRGGTGAVYHQGKIYLVGGITNGHMNGYVSWFDEYDPVTGEWNVLDDAPHKRDHLSAALHNDKLYVVGGRQTEHEIGNDFGPTLVQGDIYDYTTGKWMSDVDQFSIPTTRAGNMTIALPQGIIVGGGESEHQQAAHNEVEMYVPLSEKWVQLPALIEGRHGTGFAVIDGYLYTASGCGMRGGEPELASIERLKLDSIPVQSLSPSTQDSVALWQTLELDFLGPDTSEVADINPFTDYKLTVDFIGPDNTYSIRGFYAADGDAANTQADAGNVWRARFSPNQVGDWRYVATLNTGKNIAVRTTSHSNDQTILRQEGSFTVTTSSAQAPDFRASDRGWLHTHNGYFQFSQSGKYWVKGGTNSPENLLAYVDFDDTYRFKTEDRDGEASATGDIHKYEPHLIDWHQGAPTWNNDKGKALIGAMNYLASQGMNSSYFITMNINGDGNDVWPYRSPTERDRFDVSKLAQWEVLFSHMQARGILLHMVIQETENELMLDGGDTGFQRSLYLNELIARFAHHPALVWNLGEENGPVSWRPEGQNDNQRKEMIAFFQNKDPYQHPVFLHTHAMPEEKDHILTPLLGIKGLDGLSFQVAHRRDVFDETLKWRTLSKEHGNTWAITMDEIGMWHTGAKPDNAASQHDSLRRHVLWGHLMAGGAGVEWYFGAHYPQNDLSTEDFRSRESLWYQTNIALKFFNNIPYSQMSPCAFEIIDREDAYCFAKPDSLYVIYLPEGGTGVVTIPGANTDYNVSWFDPLKGESSAAGSVQTVSAGQRGTVGFAKNENGTDRILILSRRT